MVSSTFRRCLPEQSPYLWSTILLKGTKREIFFDDLNLLPKSQWPIHRNSQPTWSQLVSFINSLRFTFMNLINGLLILQIQVESWQNNNCLETVLNQFLDASHFLSHSSLCQVKMVRVQNKSGLHPHDTQLVVVLQTNHFNVFWSLTLVSRSKRVAGDKSA